MVCDVEKLVVSIGSWPVYAGSSPVIAFIKSASNKVYFGSNIAYYLDALVYR